MVTWPDLGVAVVVAVRSDPGGLCCLGLASWTVCMFSDTIMATAGNLVFFSLNFRPLNMLIHTGFESLCFD